MPHLPANTDVPTRRILASYSMDAEGASDWLRAFLHSLANSAAAALTREGVDVVFVDAARATDDPYDLVKDADGVIVLGGADLEPAAYGQERATDKLYGVNPHADAFELALTDAALDSGTPFLGICRGMQVLNVARGGTLVQDLGPGTMHSVESDNSTMTAHEVTIVPGSLLGGIYPSDSLEIRSGHHQAVDVLGEGLTVSGVAADGTVEAIEVDAAQTAGGPTMGGWALGVQWHPEDPAADAQHLTTLMAEFARQCAAGSSTTPQQENT